MDNDYIDMKSLNSELVDDDERSGNAICKKEETHRTTETNRGIYISTEKETIEKERIGIDQYISRILFFFWA